MKLPAAEQQGIFGNYFLFASSDVEFNPKEIKQNYHDRNLRKRK
jgi:hypothetical protein